MLYFCESWILDFESWILDVGFYYTTPSISFILFLSFPYSAVISIKDTLWKFQSWCIYWNLLDIVWDLNMMEHI